MTARGTSAQDRGMPRYLPATDNTRGALLPYYSAPWSAIAMMREWVVDRASEIAASGAPDAEDYREVIGADGEGWDIIGLCERIETVLLTNPSLIEESWTIGPWWSRQVALVEDVRWTDDRPAIATRMSEHVEQTARHHRNTDGTIRTSRKRQSMKLGGRGKRTADGQALPDAMAAFGALLPESGASVQDAYLATMAMHAQGLLPEMLGGDDWCPRELTPVLAGLPNVERALFSSDGEPLANVSVENVSEGWRKRPLKGRRVSVRKDGAIIVSERCSDPRSIVIVRDESDRAIELRRPMGKQRRIVRRYLRCEATPVGPNTRGHIVNRVNTSATAPVPPNVKRTAVRSIRAELVDMLATLTTEGARLAYGEWTVTVESAATTRHAARLTATDGQRTMTDTPRAMASALAQL